jgi:hypothetical protein
MPTLHGGICFSQNQHTLHPWKISIGKIPEK